MHNGLVQVFAAVESASGCVSNAARKTAIADTSAAECGAVVARNIPIEIDLQMIIDAWPKLNPSRRAGIVAMVRAASAVMGIVDSSPKRKFRGV